MNGLEKWIICLWIANIVCVIVGIILISIPIMILSWFFGILVLIGELKCKTIDLENDLQQLKLKSSKPQSLESCTKDVQVEEKQDDESDYTHR